MGNRELKARFGLSHLIIGGSVLLFILPAVFPQIEVTTRLAQSLGKFYYYFCGALLVFGLISWFIKTYKIQDWNIYCSKCDQRLGDGGNFTQPCPKCGSNRYTKSKN